MYDISGDFGQVRHVRQLHSSPQWLLPFEYMNGGWHKCNDKYCWERESGCENGHLFLFSVSEGGRLGIDGKEAVELPAGSVAWLPPRRQHTYYTEHQQNWEFYWIHIKEADWLHPEDIFGDCSFLPISFMNGVSQEFEKILCDRRMDDWQFQIESSRIFGNIYHLLLQECYVQKVNRQKGDRLVYDIIRELETSYDRNWKLPELAQQYYISVPQLIRRFRTETGMTPYAYLLTVRLQAAKTYLKCSSMSVEEISKKTGFQSSSNFVMQFKKNQGTTPQKYRLDSEI